MEYKCFGDTIVARLDPGDEMIECLKEICRTEGVRLGEVKGLGALNEVTIGLFDTKEKVYHGQDLQGMYEIVSLVGNVSRMDGQVYLHCHIAVGDVDGVVLGGHMNSATVSATAELYIRVIEGDVGRKFSEEIGLNLIEF